MQGSPTSRVADVDDALKQRTRMEDEWLGNDSGSMDSVTTPQLSRSADIAEMPINELNRFYEETLGGDSRSLTRLYKTTSILRLLREACLYARLPNG